MGCAADLHPLRDTIDKRLREGVFPAPLSRWIAEQTPDRLVSQHILSRHRRQHLGLAPMGKKEIGGRHPDKGEETKEPQPQGPKPSEQLKRDVTDDDIEQRLKRRFYDAIDQIPPEKVAELMIEREKAKGRVPAAKPAGAKPTEEEVPTEIADLRAAANAALGPKRTRTSTRSA